MVNLYFQEKSFNLTSKQFFLLPITIHNHIDATCEWHYEDSLYKIAHLDKVLYKNTHFFQIFFACAFFFFCSHCGLQKNSLKPMCIFQYSQEGNNHSFFATKESLPYNQTHGTTRVHPNTRIFQAHLHFRSYFKDEKRWSGLNK